MDAAPGAFPEEPQTSEELAALGPMASLGAVFYAHAVIRTRFFDDYLITATAAGCSQLVLPPRAWTRGRSGWTGRRAPACSRSTCPMC